ncbi:corticosteroid-binding globulin [Pipistrellus kuhlii]|uniref:Corticosteroid-binding globulin n=1 Tax=Pipistrellus kuhlii TaxID=59472 RepID=A0A7J7RAP6_PIPKU|nr:corticosteroid-binding globulin [Pipistrellus kuhlii]KAF6273035.1 serpin family A member 6 [Pipistrellus kuhlii]
MLLALCACLLWLSPSGLRAAQAEDADADMSGRSQHRVLAPNNVDFAFGLYKHLVALTPGKNVFISPVSISMALSMLSLGAQGQARAQLLQDLGFNRTDISEAEIHQGFQHLYRLLTESDTTLEVTMGNALFLSQSLELRQPFSEDTKRYYELDTVVTDFQDWARAHKQINEHIKNKTHGKVVDLFSELDSPAMLILVNYIFFKGTWKHPFDPASTKEEDFYVNETTLVKVPMMFQSNNINYLKDPVLPCRLVQLDYVGNGTVFFILPDKGQIDVVIEALSRDTIQRWSDSLTSSPVDLYIPKVSLSEAYDLGGLLEDMGIADLLTNQANFSGVTQGAQLKMSKVIHKATLQLDEAGAEEAAPTGATQNVAPGPLSIHFNQPFIMLVFDHFTWSSLFLVKVVDPTQASTFPRATAWADFRHQELHGKDM